MKITKKGLMFAKSLYLVKKKTTVEKSKRKTTTPKEKTRKKKTIEWNFSNKKE